MRKENFYMIPENIFDEYKLSYGAILLYGIIYSLSKPRGYAYANNDHYSTLLKCSNRTITNLLNELKNKKIIFIEYPRSFKRKIYITNIFLSS